MTEKIYSRKDYPKIYETWDSMRKRCYGVNIIKRCATYKEVIVCDEWYNFQNFARWHEENYKEYMQGWHLDKDILLRGNKIYSPETCCFVPREINMLLVKRNKFRGELPIGVVKKRKKYRYSMSLYGESRKGLVVDTPEEAFQEYKEVKEKHIKEVADKWKGLISDQVYQALYNYKVEITD